jgi:hypothetical protein
MEISWKYWLARLFRGEQRAEKRVYVGDVLDMAFRASGEETFHYDCAARDISSKGIRFAYQYPLARGTQLFLQLGFPARYRRRERLHIGAHVIHCYKLKDQRRYRIGCEFTEGDAAAFAEIEKFLAWLRKMGG